MSTRRGAVRLALPVAILVLLGACSESDVDPIVEPPSTANEQAEEQEGEVPAVAVDSEDAEAPPQPTVEEPAAPQPTALDRTLAQRVSFHFMGASAKDVVRYVSETRGVNIVIDPAVSDAMAAAAVSVKLTDVSVGGALRAVARLTGTGVRAEGDVVTITTADAGDPAPSGVDRPSEALAEKLAKKVSVDFVETRAGQVFDYVCLVGGLNVVLVSTSDAPLDQPDVTLKLADVETRTVLETTVRLMGASMEIQDDIVFVVP